MWVVNVYAPPMKMSPVRFLQTAVVLIGIGALALLLVEPHLEGRNLHATLFEIYFRDPFLAYVYVVSVFFFVGLSRVYLLLGYVGQGSTFSRQSLRAVRTLKHCAMLLAASIAMAMIYLFVVVRGEDDIAGGVAVSLVLLVGSAVVAAVASALEGTVRRLVAATAKTA
jgi:hypothetical protein